MWWGKRCRGWEVGGGGGGGEEFSLTGGNRNKKKVVGAENMGLDRLEEGT